MRVDRRLVVVGDLLGGDAGGLDEPPRRLGQAGQLARPGARSPAASARTPGTRRIRVVVLRDSTSSVGLRWSQARSASSAASAIQRAQTAWGSVRRSSAPAARGPRRAGWVRSAAAQRSGELGFVAPRGRRAPSGSGAPLVRSGRRRRSPGRRRPGSARSPGAATRASPATGSPRPPRGTLPHRSWGRMRTPPARPTCSASARRSSPRSPVTDDLERSPRGARLRHGHRPDRPVVMRAGLEGTDADDAQGAVRTIAEGGSGCRHAGGDHHRGRVRSETGPQVLGLGGRHDHEGIEGSLLVGKALGEPGGHRRQGRGPGRAGAVR